MANPALRGVMICYSPLLSTSGVVPPINTSSRWRNSSLAFCCFKFLWMMPQQTQRAVFPHLGQLVPGVLHTTPGESKLKSCFFDQWD